MKLSVLVVRDVAANAFMVPFFVQTVGIGLRSFTDEVNRPDTANMMHQHPSDFSLYDLGFYDDATAKFDLYDNPVLVVHASQVSAQGTAAPQASS